jgi:hypothetical protein
MPAKPLWLEKPGDTDAHAFRVVVDGGRYQALCGLVEDPKILSQPEDEYGPRHEACLIALGTEEAARQDEVRAEMRGDLRAELSS